MSDNTEKAIDAAADVAEEMGQQMEAMAQTIRSLNRAKVQFYCLGMAIGGLTGAVLAYKFAYSKAETKYSKIADKEVEEMRRHYMEKGKALESEAAKRPVDELVEERGYVSFSEIDPDAEPPDPDLPPPMVVKPPTPAPSNEKEYKALEEHRARQRTVDRINAERERNQAENRNIFEEAEITHEWNWHEERRRRSPDIPYVIHIDEIHDLDYQSVTLTYYTLDDVLCNERDEVIDPDERDGLIGDANLDRFGHGSNDASIVYVRNDKLELVYEICKSPNSFAEEVHGFSHSEYGKNLERMRVRERDESED
jgi:hypothetical protein